MSEMFELETRRKIFELITQNPGLHFSKIVNLLGLRISLVEYHLAFLEKNELITAVREPGYKRYYVSDLSIGAEDRRLLPILRQEIPLGIVLFLLQHPHATHKELAQNFNIAKSTLSYHLKKLIKKGIIIEGYRGKRGYTIANKKEILALLMRYKPYSVIEAFKDIWFDLQVD